MIIAYLGLPLLRYDAKPLALRGSGQNDSLVRNQTDSSLRCPSLRLLDARDSRLVCVLRNIRRKNRKDIDGTLGISALKLQRFVSRSRGKFRGRAPPQYPGEKSVFSRTELPIKRRCSVLSLYISKGNRVLSKIALLRLPTNELWCRDCILNLLFSDHRPIENFRATNLAYRPAATTVIEQSLQSLPTYPERILRIRSPCTCSFCAIDTLGFYMVSARRVLRNYIRPNGSRVRATRRGRSRAILNNCL